MDRQVSQRAYQGSFLFFRSLIPRKKELYSVCVYCRIWSHLKVSLANCPNKVLYYGQKNPSTELRTDKLLSSGKRKYHNPERRVAVVVSRSINKATNKLFSDKKWTSFVVSRLVTSGWWKTMVCNNSARKKPRNNVFSPKFSAYQTPCW